MVDALEYAIAGLGRLAPLAPDTRAQVASDLGGYGVPELEVLQHVDGVRERRLVWGEGSRSDGIERVAEHGGKHERDDPRRERGTREPAALDLRQVFAHGVEFLDRRARLEQQIGGQLERAEVQPVRRQL